MTSLVADLEGGGEGLRKMFLDKILCWISIFLFLVFLELNFFSKDLKDFDITDAKILHLKILLICFCLFDGRKA